MIDLKRLADAIARQSSQDAIARYEEALKACSALTKAIQERDEARRERDEARAQAVWSIHVNAPIGWVACAPGGGGEGLRLVDGAWVEQTMCISEGTRFSTEAEALAAGRALPWWEVLA